MNWVDYTFAAIVVLSLLIGVWRGLVREAISLATLIAAFIVAALHAPEVGGWLASAIDSPLARGITAHVLVFVAVLLAGALVTWLVSRAVDATGLSGFNRLLGAGFGVARGVLIVVAMTLLAERTVVRDEPLWRAAALRPTLLPLAASLERLVPPAWLSWLPVPAASSSSRPET